MHVTALLCPPLIVNAAVEIAKALLVNVANELPAAPATVAVALTTVPAEAAVIPMVFELAAICAAKFVAIAVVLAPTLNWFAVNEDTAATKLAPPTVTVTGFTPPLKAAVEIAVGLVLVTLYALQNVPDNTHVIVTVVLDESTLARIPSANDGALLMADAKFTAVFVDVLPGATLPPIMNNKVPGGGPKIAICVPLTFDDTTTTPLPATPTATVVLTAVNVPLAVAVLNPV
jgi:hypothetical protein